MVGRVAELWRYPVKSLVGERLPAVPIEERGIAADRLWSVRDTDGKFGSGKSTRRFRRMDGLLELSASLDGDVPAIVFPDGRRLRGDDAAIGETLSAHVGRQVTLGREETVSHFDEGPLHLVTSSSLLELARVFGRSVDPRRLRPNIVLDTGDEPALVEDGWIGRQLTIGEVVVSIRTGMTRCVMVDLPQVDLAHADGLLKAIGARSDARLGVVVDVVRPGVVREGDPAALVA